MRKLVYLIIALIILALSVSFGSTAAQEPTEESPPVVVVEENQEVPVTVPDGGVVVVPTEDNNQGWLTTLSMIISGIVALSAIASQYLTSAQRQKILDIGEVAESATWNVALGTSQIINAIGGNPDIAISDDPTVLAKALRDGNVHVFIKSGADVKAIVEAYNKTSPGG